MAREGENVNHKTKPKLANKTNVDNYYNLSMRLFLSTMLCVKGKTTVCNIGIVFNDF